MNRKTMRDTTRDETAPDTGCGAEAMGDCPPGDGEGSAVACRAFSPADAGSAACGDDGGEDGPDREETPEKDQEADGEAPRDDEPGEDPVDPEEGASEAVEEAGREEEPPADGDGEDGEEGDEEEEVLPLGSVVEAVLFAAREPLKAAQIARAVGRRTRQEAVRQAIRELNVQYLETGRAFEIADISGRYQLMSRPEYARHIMKIYPKKDLTGKDKAHRLTPTAMDTLAIVAYKQPVTRGEIEHIRGVACGSVLKTLIERGSVRVVGKRTDLVGQPRVYGTTEAFLAEFGLGSLDELPLRNDFLGLLGDDGGTVELFLENDQDGENEGGDGADGMEGAPDAVPDSPDGSPAGAGPGDATEETLPDGVPPENHDT